MIFTDRRAAGQVLAHQLADYAGRPGVLVLALPRGGVPVGAEVAHLLNLPLDVFVVRKLGCPGHEELALGALASGGMQVLNVELLAELNMTREQVAAIAKREAEEIKRREQAYRGSRPPLELRGQTVLVVDDGLATGATMTAAVLALRKLGAAKTVVAVPVGSPETCRKLRTLVGELVCAYEPEEFRAVGEYYDDFAQTSDDEVRAALGAAA
jgi:predicted phosphoribosyltransferase